MADYGKELILDLHGCNPATFNRTSIEEFFRVLCDEKIDMKRCALHWWDDLETPEEEKQTDPHLVGTSAVQFILTSDIVIHTLSLMKRVYLNIFSCKEFDESMVAQFAREWFGGVIVQQIAVRRI